MITLIWWSGDVDSEGIRQVSVYLPAQFYLGSIPFLGITFPPKVIIFFLNAKLSLILMLSQVFQTPTTISFKESKFDHA